MKIFQLLTAFVLANLIYFAKCKNANKNVLKNAEDQLEWLQFKAYWEACYFGESVIGKAEFKRILGERKENAMPSFRSMAVGKKLIEFEKIIQNLDNSKAGPAPCQLEQLEQIQDSTAFKTSTIFITKGNQTGYLPYPDFANSEKQIYSELLDNYLISYENSMYIRKDPGPLSSYDKIAFIPPLKLVYKTERTKQYADLNKKLEYFHANLKLLLDVKTFPNGIKNLEDQLQFKAGDVLRYLETFEGRYFIAYKLASAIYATKKPSEFFIYLVFYENTVISSVLNVEKVFNETLKDVGKAEYKFCKLNVPNWSLTSEERRVIGPVMKLVSSYFAARLAREVESVSFEEVYGAINYGCEMCHCWKYELDYLKLLSTESQNYFV